ncbi:MAG: hypothetical protein ACI8PP_001492 [Candidatus Pseudothioglobus sp.]|jgi:hypothetical protein
MSHSASQLLMIFPLTLRLIRGVRVGCTLLCVSLMSFALQSQAEAIDVPVLSPEQLDNYQFPTQPDAGYTIEALSFGQIHVMDKQREDIKTLFERRLRALSMKGMKSDLAYFQALVDQRVLRPEQTEEWQALGVVFGDLLVNEFGLRWVSYEDELGASKALRWRKTDNFVFPVTVFSKRVQFGEKIDVTEIYNTLEAEIVRFKRLSLNGPPN